MHTDDAHGTCITTPARRTYTAADVLDFAEVRLGRNVLRDEGNTSTRERRGGHGAERAAVHGEHNDLA